jgi:hypothetical protein
VLLLAVTNDDNNEQKKLTPTLKNFADAPRRICAAPPPLKICKAIVEVRRRQRRHIFSA